MRSYSNLSIFLAAVGFVVEVCTYGDYSPGGGVRRDDFERRTLQPRRDWEHVFPYLNSSTVQSSMSTPTDLMTANTSTTSDFSFIPNTTVGTSIRTGIGGSIQHPTVALPTTSNSTTGIWTTTITQTASPHPSFSNSSVTVVTIIGSPNVTTLPFCNYTVRSTRTKAYGTSIVTHTINKTRTITDIAWETKTVTWNSSYHNSTAFTNLLGDYVTPSCRPITRTLHRSFKYSSGETWTTTATVTENKTQKKTRTVYVQVQSKAPEQDSPGKVTEVPPKNTPVSRDPQSAKPSNNPSNGGIHGTFVNQNPHTPSNNDPSPPAQRPDLPESPGPNTRKGNGVAPTSNPNGEGHTNGGNPNNPTANPDGEHSNGGPNPTGNPNKVPGSHADNPNGTPNGGKTNGGPNPTGNPTGPPHNPTNNPNGTPNNGQSNGDPNPTVNPNEFPNDPTNNPNGGPNNGGSSNGGATGNPNGGQTNDSPNPTSNPNGVPGNPTHDPHGTPSHGSGGASATSNLDADPSDPNGQSNGGAGPDATGGPNNNNGGSNPNGQTGTAYPTGTNRNTTSSPSSTTSSRTRSSTTALDVPSPRQDAPSTVVAATGVGGARRGNGLDTAAIGIFVAVIVGLGVGL